MFFFFFIEEKSKSTVATIEGGNVVAGQRELSKGAEYFEKALELTSKFIIFFLITVVIILINFFLLYF